MKVKKEGKDLKKTEWMYKVVHSFHYILPYLRRSACLCDNHAPHELSRTHFSAAVQQFFQLELTCPFLRYLQHTRRVLCPQVQYLKHFQSRVMMAGWRKALLLSRKTLLSKILLIARDLFACEEFALFTGLNKP